MGVTRKLLSMSTVGMVDFRSDKERVARSARKTLHETRKQTALLRQAAAPDGPGPAVASIATMTPMEWWAARTSWTDRLTANPDREVRYWIVWAAVALFAAIATPASLLLSLPVGVYLFACRQAAARNRARAEVAAMMERVDPPTVPIVTVPDPVRLHRVGRHAQ